MSQPFSREEFAASISLAVSHAVRKEFRVFNAAAAETHDRITIAAYNSALVLYDDMNLVNVLNPTRRFL